MKARPVSKGFIAHGLTVDAVVFGYAGDRLQIALIQRAIEPYLGRWALPGGFVLAQEGLEDAVKRELREEAGLSNVFLEQLYTFGGVGRDPRGRVVSVAYYGLVRPEAYPVVGGSDASQARWFNVDDLQAIAFDHKSIIRLALERLRSKISYSPIGFELLSEKFTLSQIQQLYEVILGHSLDKRNFRKKLLSLRILKAMKEHQTGVPHRAAALYTFDRQQYLKLHTTGFGLKFL